MERSTELEALTSRLYEAVSAADIGFVESLLSRDAGVLMIGTNPEEWWQGHDPASSFA